MKFILITFLFSLSAYCQTENFIQQEPGKLIWQKVFNDTISPNDLLKNLKLTGKFDRLEISNQDIDFTLSYSTLDFKEFGYESMKDAIFLKNGGKCKGIIEFKDKKYRVTVFSIDVIDPMEGIQIYSANIYFFKGNGQVKDNKIFTRAFSYYNQYFIKSFTVKPQKEDW